jgi:NAD(P)H-flavin reductase
MTSTDEAVQILVCQARSCRLAGAVGAQLEIEELVKGLGCSVSETDCVGNCSQAPNAVIIRLSGTGGGQRGGDEEDEGELVANISSLAVSAQVVEQATGVRPSLDDPALLDRLGNARQARLAEEAKASARWNCALGALAGMEASLRGKNDKLHALCQVLMDQAACLESARQPVTALAKVEEVLAHMPGNVTAYFARSSLLYAVGRVDEGRNVLRSLVAVPPQSRFAVSVAREARRLLAERESSRVSTGLASLQDGGPPDGFATWKLERVEVLSRWTAIYHLRSDDPRRGAVHKKGRGRTIWRKLWHTTLLAAVGANDEGPLPYIERDYTAVSTAQDWNEGACRLLIKIYPHGKATQWIARYLQGAGSTVQLSTPVTTLRVPSLVPEKADIFSVPRGVLVLSGGTGIAPLVQILQSFGALKIPLICFHSCRADDVVLLSELDELCRARSGSAITRVTVCITPASTEQDGAFANPPAVPLGQLHMWQSMTFHYGRITEALLMGALRDLPAPCRGVITGPEAFNAQFSVLLAKLGLRRENQTVLEA